jgi:hypothetical protein
MPSNELLTANQIDFALRARKTVRDLRDEARAKDLESLTYFLDMTYLMLSETIAKSAEHLPVAKRRRSQK